LGGPPAIDWPAVDTGWPIAIIERPQSASTAAPQSAKILPFPRIRFSRFVARPVRLRPAPKSSVP
jgi:hypothetical protein